VTEKNSTKVDDDIHWMDPGKILYRKDLVDAFLTKGKLATE
jgi:hypothetical protein